MGKEVIREQRTTGQLLTRNQRTFLTGKLTKHTNPSKVKGEIRRIHEGLPQIVPQFIADLLLLQNNFFESEGQRQINYRAIENGIKALIEKSDLKQENLGIQGLIEEQRKREMKIRKSFEKFVADGGKTIDKLYADKSQNRLNETVKKLERYPKATKVLLQIYSEILVKQSSNADLLLQKRPHGKILNQLKELELISEDSGNSKYFTLTDLGMQVGLILKAQFSKRHF